MASLSLLTFSLLLFLTQPSFSFAKPHKLRPQFLQTLTPQNDEPTRFFEVTKPIKATTKPCSYLVLTHDFGFTYGKPPVLADYSFPTRCGRGGSSEFSKIVIEWTATCQGRQFDRIFGVWLAGVELLRSCTAEPRASGIVWTVQKDVTRYYSLLVDEKKKNQTLSVYLGNLIDNTYTGVYHVNLTFHFYPSEETIKGSDSWADLVLPISRNLPLNDGLWFEIQNSEDSKFKEVKIPRNAYRAVLEVYVSFHENDEFWYGNLPNEYIEANNLTGFPGNGPFREVLASLDGEIVGAVWPFTVIFTGGVNPLLWRPISAIGSFDLPSYDIEITPFLGKLLDGKSHRFAFNVTEALNVWYIDANLHIWLDQHSERTRGKLLEHISLPLDVSLVLNFTGLEGNFVTKVSRSVVSKGWIESSYGNMSTGFVQDFYYSNAMAMQNDGATQIVDQVIYFNDSAFARDEASSNIHSSRSLKKFSFHMYSTVVDQGNETHAEISNVTLGFNERKTRGSSGVGFSSSEVDNSQEGQGNIVVRNHLVLSGLGSTQQVYKYVGPDLCYFRNISSSNYTILHDNVETQCGKIKRGFGIHRLVSFHPKKGFYGV